VRYLDLDLGLDPDHPRGRAPGRGSVCGAVCRSRGAGARPASSCALSPRGSGSWELTA